MEQITRVPPATLALELLQRIPERGYVRRASTISAVIGEAAPRVPGRSVVSHADVMQEHPVATMALVEAWQRLVLDALIVNWPQKDPQYSSDGWGEVFQLTSWGKHVRARGGDGKALVAARRRLGVDLHEELADRLRDVVAVGAFEQAALLALRAIEARVRALTAEPRGKRGDLLTGTTLMQHAFGDNGPLTDPDAEPGERVGTMSLFVGAFGAVRNRLVHTEVEWSDSVEAAEYVLFADLLMRLLDRAAERLAVGVPDNS